MEIKNDRNVRMELTDLQADLRHFAAERDWQPRQTPKNLSTALMVEAAELAEIFQWMTPEESQRARLDPTSKQRIGEEVADVLLYLLQVADHSGIDIAQAVKDKLVRNALKYPATRVVARVSPVRAGVSGTHVLLDYENVQPTEDQLRALVPDASQVWVFHGPHQRQIEKRFPSFGTSLTAVPVSRTGKNALDFHLSFYMGYIASKNRASAMIVIANDKGYEPMLEHARALGFAVRQQGYVKAISPISESAVPVSTPHSAVLPAATKVAEKKPAAKKAAAKKMVAKTPPAKKAAAKKAPGTKAVARKTATNLAQTAKARKATAPRPATGVVRPIAQPLPSWLLPLLIPLPPLDSADLLKKLTANLQKMGSKRPAKSSSLRRALKSWLGAEPGDALIERALDKLIAAGVVAVGADSNVTYPKSMQ